MWNRRKAFRAGREVDTALRAQRVEPSDEFVDGLSRHVAAHGRAARPAWSRVAFAGAVTTFVLGSFASFGGLGYAASGAAGGYHAVKRVVVKHALIVSVHRSSAAAQYAPAPKPKHKTTVHVAGAQAGAGVAGVSAGLKTGKTLPFTGISLLGTLVLSLALIIAGITLRRRERRS
jgi:hypothetical protein